MSEVHGRGRCLCRAISYEVHAPMRAISFCHCAMCRRAHGSAGAYTTALVDSLVLHDREGALRWYRSSDHVQRGFCGTCGSALFWQADDADHVSIMAGAFDGEPGLKMAYHIFCADKGDFYEINDGLPQYGKGSPNLAVAPDD